VSETFIRNLRLRGGAAAILWGHRDAATLRSWVIGRINGQWMLKASIERIDAFGIRQPKLLFTAPHERGRDGFWAWGVESIEVGTHVLLARLGPPEQ
jgi:hypothetical protein